MHSFKICVFMLLIIVSQSIEECKNLDNKYLDELFSDYLTLYRNYEEKIFQKIESLPINHHHHNDYIEDESFKNKADFFDKTQCDITLRNRLFCFFFSS